MKITIDLLEKMRFEYSPITDTYDYSRFSLSLRSVRDNVWLFFKNGKYHSDDSYITDVEDMLDIIYDIAYDDGIRQKTEEIRKALAYE